MVIMVPKLLLDVDQNDYALHFVIGMLPAFNPCSLCGRNENTRKLTVIKKKGTHTWGYQSHCYNIWATTKNNRAKIEEKRNGHTVYEYKKGVWQPIPALSTTIKPVKLMTPQQVLEEFKNNPLPQR